MTHWYEQPAEVCALCGDPPDSPSHKRRCPSIWSFGPGFAFCEKEVGHDGPHHCRNWDDSLWEVSDSGKKPSPAKVIEAGTCYQVGETK